MKKTKLLSPISIYFLIMGSLFGFSLLVGVIVYYCNWWDYFNTNPDAFPAYCGITGIGCAMFCFLAAYLINYNRKWRKSEDLRSTGIRKDAIVVDLVVDPTNQSNSFGHVVCQEAGVSENPKMYNSFLMNYNYCVKKCPIGSLIPVYVDPQDPDHYFVDVDCAYTDEEQLQEICEDTNLEDVIEDNRVITFETCHPEYQSSSSGWTFVGVGVIILYFLIVSNKPKMGVSQIVGILLFALFGCVFLYVGISSIYQQKRKKKLSVLVVTGMKYQATLEDIVRHDVEKKQGKDLVRHVLYFKAVNPITGEEEKFHEETFDPRIRKERVESGVVDVYVDPNKPKDTFLYFSSCVLKLKG